ncbi:response regulator transcription factor [Devosia sp. XJ19-1]|uniref:Response regulator transcription factor n=1 Tax=Devosia ureilytica TaxID=2952754 RepID=A0A9Q4AP24_9HYPH|nr:response regulator transcription factor [Devosia ureilytica]MCP8883731.1 response regulator transcription factor [Devosia ureilytica]MCP8887339.1 response regulator transcription factor [Devosia ureilytica]
MSKPITVAIADDHPVLLAGMVSLFSSSDKHQIIGQASSADTSMALVCDYNPDVIIMDLSMPGDVFRTIAQIVATAPNTKVIVFTAFCSIESALKALDAGATGFALKGSPSSELIEAIDTVMAGQLFVTRQYASQVMNGLRERARRQALAEAVKLNVREKQIIGHLMQARTNREIAAQLNISEKTVKHYMTGLMLKLKARNRVEVVIASRLRQDQQQDANALS